ncbi:MAG: MFS transporter, partial [Synergistales bacterium]|nr:MFS transporter [Synergistales bacterium]
FLSLPVREKGLPASLFYTVNAVTCIVLRVFGGQFIKNIPRYLLGCVSIMIMAVALTGALEANTSLTLTLSAVGYGCGMGFGFPVMLALIPDVFPPRLMPKGSSIGMLSMDLGFALSPLIIGALSVYLGTPGAMRAIAWGQLVIAPTALILWKISIKRKLSFDKKEESECLIR